jgi:ACS family tartrate transporter-like MFS transporter
MATLAEPVERESSLEAATMSRVSRRLIPLLFCLYIVCFIDRTNVSVAALQMNRDLAFSAAVYGLGAGIFFLGYALFEVPSNLILARVGARRWIGRIAITWGLLAVGMMFVRTAGSFYTMRFLLGVAEAGYFPGIVYYLSHWYPERRRARAISRFAIGVPLAGGIGGPLGATLLGLDGSQGLAGWQWLFLIEGIPAVLLGLVALRYLTDQPDDARWLTDAERAWLAGRLAAEREASAALGHATFRQALQSPTLWWLTAPYVLFAVANLALILWLPLLLKAQLAITDREIGWILGLIGVAGAGAMLLIGASSDRRGDRIGHAAGALAVAAVGCVVAALAPQPLVAVAGIAVAVVSSTAFLPVFWCIPSTILRGTAAAGGIALVNAIGNAGGFLGPNLLGQVKDATGSFSSGFLVLAGLTLLGAALMLRLRRRWSIDRR